MNFDVQLYQSECADGVYIIQAQGFITASLYWSDGTHILENWTAFAHIPLNERGEGVLQWRGGQKIPSAATHVAAILKGVDDFFQTVYAPLPSRNVENMETPSVRFVVMSDLHLSSRSGKLGRLQRALRLGKNADCVLLVGDLTNDGTAEQLQQFMQCIEEELPDVPVLCVTGNHDYPRYPLPLVEDATINSYPEFQHYLITRAQSMGIACEETDCGAYRAWVKGIPVIGLNAVSHFRRFVFEQGEQLIHLEKWISEENSTKSIVLCHAPLIHHNPVRHPETHPAYLSRDKKIQEILDQIGNVVFLSGHTHISMNDIAGCVDIDGTNLYINDSSITKTMLHNAESIEDAEWLDGSVLNLSILNNQRIQLTGQCISSQKYIARAHYFI